MVRPCVCVADRCDSATAAVRAQCTGTQSSSNRRAVSTDGATIGRNRSVVAQMVGLIVHNRAVAEAENGQLLQEQVEGVAPGGQGEDSHAT